MDGCVPKLRPFLTEKVNNIKYITAITLYYTNVLKYLCRTDVNITPLL
jgi:hypothetical protein